MFIKRKYLVRHKILDALQRKLDQFKGIEHIPTLGAELSMKELMQLTKIPEHSLSGQTDYMDDVGEITGNWRDGVLMFLILKKGSISYANKSHIVEGRKEFWNNTYDVVKTVSAIILLVIAVTTFVINIIETKSNKKEIEKLKNQLQQVKRLNNTNTKLPYEAR